jgi:hypothetical protein
MQLDVRLQVDSMLRLKADGIRQVRKAAAYALNRAIDKGRSVGSKAISAATKIKTRDVALRMSVVGANPDRLIATLEAHPYAPNLSKFRATQRTTGVAATAWEGRKTYQHAFINPKTGRVVTRTTDQRTPLKGLRGPSVRRTFMQQAILEQVSMATAERFTADFERDVTRRLGS